MGEFRKGKQVAGARKPKRLAVPGAGRASNNRGDVSEMQFMIQASNRGFGVAKPFGHNERYDVILDAGPRRLLRVQVKGSGCWRNNGFAVDTCWRTSRGREPYTAEQIDFLAAVYSGRKAHGRQIWYVIPVRALGGRLNIKLYPFGDNCAIIAAMPGGPCTRFVLRKRFTCCTRFRRNRRAASPLRRGILN